MVLGNFNTRPGPLTGDKITNHRSSLYHQIIDTGLIMFNDHLGKFTFSSANGSSVIDYIFASPTLKPNSITRVHKESDIKIASKRNVILTFG